jgi:predicted permease
MTATHEGFAFRRALIAFQAAVCFVLVFGALLFTKSFYNLMSVDSGYQRHGVFMAHLFFRDGDLPVARRDAFYSDLTERIRSLPDIGSLAYASTPPLSGFFSDTQISVKGQIQGESNMNRVSPGYFATMGTPVLTGRDFGRQDTVSSPRVALVTETFARRFFGDAPPVGQTFSMPGGAGQRDTDYQVIGVVKDSKYHTIREEFAPIVFAAASQDVNAGLTRRYIVRANGPIGSVMSSIRRTVLEASPSAALRFGVLETQIQESLLRERLMAMLASAFGAISMVLAAVGLYGVLSYIIAKRRNEIGIRMALGADRAGILRMVLAEVTALLAIGLTAGVGLALLSARAATTLLYGLEWFDPGMLTLTLVTLCGTGLAAGAWPTFKAAGIEPSQALRES